MAAERNTLEKLSARQKILLLIVDCFTKGLRGLATSSLLHEYVFLLRAQRSAVPSLEHYDFQAYVKGPFSEQLREDLEALGGLGLIRVEDRKLVLTPEGEKLVAELGQDKDLESAKSSACDMLNKYPTAHLLRWQVADSQTIRRSHLGQSLQIL
jgi:hypothetical protein